jgi:putative nucleotidyltransferase with HDIG domain
MSEAKGNRKAAIILGAGRFQKASALDRTGFASSAEDFISYLLDEQLFSLPKENLLNLFDSTASPGDQLEQMCDFLDRFRDKSDEEVNDIVLYYVGHGGFVGMNKEFFLAIATTKEGLQGSTAIRTGDLSSALRDHAGRARKYLILDCCFAASAFAQFQDTGLSAVVSSQTLEPLPPKGTALLCSSGSRQVSLSPSGETHTMFSSALMEVLRKGEHSGLAAFSLDDVGRRVKELLRNRWTEEWIRPEVHSPDMCEGNVAYIPIFPNPGFDSTLAATLSPRQADYVRSLESLLAMRDGQLQKAMASLNGHLDIAMEVVGTTLRLEEAELEELSLRAKDLLKSRYPEGWSIMGMDPADPMWRKIAAKASRTDHPPDLDNSYPLNQSGEDRLRNLEALLATRTEQLQLAMSNLERSYDITLESLGDALDLKDRETEGHAKRVTAFTIAIAKAMGLPRDQINTIARGAFLHDIGKMSIPDKILNKPGKLNPDEFNIMKQHAHLGYQMVKRIPFLAEAAEIVYSHQERYDGTGYPRQLKGKEIPLGARIFSVADTLDAITSNRIYRPAKSLREAQDTIRAGAGTQFDPDVARVFLEMPDNIWEDLSREIKLQIERIGRPTDDKTRKPKELTAPDER